MIELDYWLVKATKITKKDEPPKLRTKNLALLAPDTPKVNIYSGENA